MNPTYAPARRLRPIRVPRPAAVAILYPKVGNVLRVPLRPTCASGRAGCEQHPERQFIRWFNRMAAARPGFPLQIKSILLLTGQPLCVSCRRTLARYLGQYHLAGKLRLQTAAGPCNCGGRCGAAAPPAGADATAWLANTLLDDLLTAELHYMTPPLGPVNPPLVRVPYGTDLSQRAIAFRQRMAQRGRHIGFGRNVAVARVLRGAAAGAPVPTLFYAVSYWKALDDNAHAEQTLVSLLKQHRVDPKEVTHIYSERLFCRDKKTGAGCMAATSRAVFPNAQRLFSFQTEEEAVAKATINQLAPKIKQGDWPLGSVWAPEVE